MFLRFVLTLALTFLVPALLRAEESPVHREWKVGGVTREALVYAPPSAHSTPAPVVFAFHGHGGNMAAAARTFGYQTLWPAAIVVYMQGLPTAGKLTDPEGKKPGWQSAIGSDGDRDLAFFDAVLASLRADYKVDDRRVYATGHSNGGGFTYLLWAARGDQFAAFAPSSAAAFRDLDKLRPKPMLHVAGETDPLVKFEWQQRTIDAVKKLNQCGEGEPWRSAGTLYPSKIGAPVVTLIHPGGHTFLREAPALIVEFFQEHPKAQ